MLSRIDPVRSMWTPLSRRRASTASSMLSYVSRSATVAGVARGAARLSAPATQRHLPRTRVGFVNSVVANLQRNRARAGGVSSGSGARRRGLRRPLHPSLADRLERQTRLADRLRPRRAEFCSAEDLSSDGDGEPVGCTNSVG